MPDFRSGAIGAAAHIAGLPWRLKPHGKPLSPDDPHLKRIVVIKPCCMGDVLMSTPVLAALRRSLPDAHIAYAVGQWSLPAIEHNPRINSLIDSPVGGADTAYADYRHLSKLISAGKLRRGACA